MSFKSFSFKIVYLAFRVLMSCLFCTLGPEHAEAQCAPREVAKLTASNGSPGDMFGQSVSIDGDTLVVGVPRDDDNGIDSGSAYVYVRDHNENRGWMRVAKLLPLDGSPSDEFGQSVSICGEIIVVGAWGDGDNGPASGSAYVFYRNTGDRSAWTQVAKLLPSDGNPSSLFGQAVSVWGEVIIVGAFLDDLNGFQAGAAYIFYRNEGGPDNWGQVVKLLAESPTIGERFGGSVGLWRTTAIVGAPGNDEQGAEAGAAYLFSRDSGGPSKWGQIKKLFASDASPGDQFGSVAISDATSIVGAGLDDQNGQYAGSAYIFDQDHGGANNWGQVVKLLPKDPAPHDEFGILVAISDDLTIVGALFDQDNGIASGSAYLFYRQMGGASQWGQVGKLLPSDAAPLDQFGFPAISGNTVVVGAPQGQPPGAAYVFESTPAYPPITYCTTKPSSIPGCVPSIQAIGVATASSLSGFILQTRKVPGGSLGLFLYTHGGASHRMQGQFGTLCIESEWLYKTGPLLAGGNPGRCDGILLFDWNLYAHAAVGYDPDSTQPGTTVDGQFWYRDPRNSGAANLTNAVGFIVCR